MNWQPKMLLKSCLATQLKATADSPYEMLTLDALTARYGMIGFLKLDVEGFKASALAGAERILSVDRPHIWVELAIGEDNMKATLARLEAHNYREQTSFLTTLVRWDPKIFRFGKPVATRSSRISSIHGFAVHGSTGTANTWSKHTTPAALT